MTVLVPACTDLGPSATSPSPSVVSAVPTGPSPGPVMRNKQLYWVGVEKSPDCPDMPQTFDATAGHYTFCIPAGWGIWEGDAHGTAPPDLTRQTHAPRLFSNHAWPWQWGDSYIKAIRERGLVDIQFDVWDAAQRVDEFGCSPSPAASINGAGSASCVYRWNIGGPGKASDQTTITANGEFLTLKYSIEAFESPEPTADSMGMPGPERRFAQPRIRVHASMRSRDSSQSLERVRAIVRTVKPYRGSHVSARIYLCDATDLRLDPEWKSSAGLYGGRWQIQNVSSRPCVIYGRPGAIVVDATGNALARGRMPSSGHTSTLRLDPSNKAVSDVAWENWCAEMTPPATLRILLPFGAGILDAAAPGKPSCRSGGPSTVTVEDFSVLPWIRFTDPISGLSMERRDSFVLEHLTATPSWTEHLGGFRLVDAKFIGTYPDGQIEARIFKRADLQESIIQWARRHSRSDSLADTGPIYFTNRSGLAETMLPGGDRRAAAVTWSAPEASSIRTLAFFEDEFVITLQWHAREDYRSTLEPLFVHLLESLRSKFE